MADRITYTDKVDLNTTSVADINKVKASDLNEIKTVVNNNATDIEYLHGTTLYESSTGATNSITLSESYSNYRYIEILGTKDNNISSVKFDITLGHRANITISRRNNSSTITIYTCMLSFSGTTATMEGGAVAFNSSGVVGFTTNNEISIIKVIGYK